LDLNAAHLPRPAWVSLLHRVSGVLLFLALPLAVWALSVSLSGEGGFERVRGWVLFPTGKLVVVLFAWALLHHWFAGLRHLTLDVHWGEDLGRARQSALVVLAAAGAGALLLAWRLFA
jgi:succinate dehydrogenase / fumarate reductase cytochrome b subunit